MVWATNAASARPAVAVMRVDHRLTPGIATMVRRRATAAWNCSAASARKSSADASRWAVLP
jgi:hypothetical protein